MDDTDYAMIQRIEALERQRDCWMILACLGCVLLIVLMARGWWL